MDNRQKVRRLGRREALQIFGAGLAVGGLASLGACSKEAAPSPGAQPSTAAPAGAPSCESAIDPESAQTRGTLQYSDVAAVPEKNCAACAQFLADKYGACGGCNLFAGPVKPAGGCLAFAPKDSNAAPADAPKPPG